VRKGQGCPRRPSSGRHVRCVGNQQTRSAAPRLGPAIVRGGPWSTRGQGRGRSVREASTDAVARKSASRMSAVWRIGSASWCRPVRPTSGSRVRACFIRRRCGKDATRQAPAASDPAVRSASPVFQPVLHVAPCGGGRRSTPSDEFLGDRGGLVKSADAVTSRSAPSTVLDAIGDGRKPRGRMGKAAV